MRYGMMRPGAMEIVRVRLEAMRMQTTKTAKAIDGGDDNGDGE
jgi:hypothetical protein